MKKQSPRRPGVAFVVALAVFVVLAGNTAYAATIAARNSVISRSIKNGEVKTADLAGGAVTASKVAGGAVTGSKLRDGVVTAPKIAAGAVTDAHLAPGSVGPVQLGTIVEIHAYSAATSDADGTSNGGDHGIAEATAVCPDGARVIAGGARWYSVDPGAQLENVYLQAQYAYFDQWYVRGVVDIGAQGTIRLKAIAYCLVPPGTN